MSSSHVALDSLDQRSVYAAPPFFGSAGTGNNRPIGVFDSGLGGLTVARCIATSLPHESIYYVGDTKRCPYGVRSEEEVRSFVMQAGRWLAEREIKIMVIACNTATAAGLQIGRAHV